MPPEPQVTIFLTTPEAQMFKDFQQFHKTFQLLCEKGVFDIKAGSATIHFDNNGFIQKIERHDNLFDARVQKLA
jgi:hypothetical protein